MLIVHSLIIVMADDRISRLFCKFLLINNSTEYYFLLSRFNPYLIIHNPLLTLMMLTMLPIIVMMAVMMTTMMMMMMMMVVAISAKDAPVLHWCCIQCPKGDWTRRISIQCTIIVIVVIIVIIFFISIAIMSRHSMDPYDSKYLIRLMARTQHNSKWPTKSQQEHGKKRQKNQR